MAEDRVTIPALVPISTGFQAASSSSNAFRSLGPFPAGSWVDRISVELGATANRQAIVGFSIVGSPSADLANFLSGHTFLERGAESTNGVPAAMIKISSNTTHTLRLSGWGGVRRETYWVIVVWGPTPGGLAGVSFTVQITVVVPTLVAVL